MHYRWIFPLEVRKTTRATGRGRHVQRLKAITLQPVLLYLLSLPPLFPQWPHCPEENPFAGAIKWCQAFNNISRWHLLLLFSKGATFLSRSIQPLERRQKARPSLYHFCSVVNYRCLNLNSGRFWAGSINAFAMWCWFLGACDLNSAHQLTDLCVDGQYVHSGEQ